MSLYAHFRQCYCANYDSLLILKFCRSHAGLLHTWMSQSGLYSGRVSPSVSVCEYKQEFMFEYFHTWLNILN